MNSVSLYSALYIPACFTNKFSVATTSPPRGNDVLRETKYCKLTSCCFNNDTYSIIDRRTVNVDVPAKCQIYNPHSELVADAVVGTPNAPISGRSCG